MRRGPGAAVAWERRKVIVVRKGLSLMLIRVGFLIGWGWEEDELVQG